MQREKSCGAIIFRKDTSQFLIIKNAGTHADHWDYPKGHVERDETEEETATREAFEETGIRIRIMPGFREVMSYTMWNGIGKDVTYFVAEPLNVDVHIDPVELHDAKWLSYDDALKTLTFENARVLLKKANGFIASSRSHHPFSRKD